MHRTGILAGDASRCATLARGQQTMDLSAFSVPTNGTNAFSCRLIVAMMVSSKVLAHEPINIKEISNMRTRFPSPTTARYLVSTTYA